MFLHLKDCDATKALLLDFSDDDIFEIFDTIGSILTSFKNFRIDF